MSYQDANVPDVPADDPLAGGYGRGNDGFADGRHAAHDAEEAAARAESAAMAQQLEAQQEQLTRLFTATVVGSDGERIGKVGQVYLDDQTQEPNWVTVKTGIFGTKEFFIPLDQATLDGKQIIVPYDKQLVLLSPATEIDQNLSPEEEDALYHHYRVPGRQASSSAAEHEPLGSPGDAGPRAFPGIPAEHGEAQYDDGQYDDAQYDSDEQYGRAQYGNDQYAGTHDNDSQYARAQYDDGQYAETQYDDGQQYAGTQYDSGQRDSSQDARAHYGNDQYAETQYGSGQHDDSQYGHAQYDDSRYAGTQYGSGQQYADEQHARTRYDDGPYAEAHDDSAQRDDGHYARPQYGDGQHADASYGEYRGSSYSATRYDGAAQGHAEQEPREHEADPFDPAREGGHALHAQEEGFSAFRRPDAR